VVLGIAHGERRARSAILVTLDPTDGVQVEHVPLAGYWKRLPGHLTEECKLDLQHAVKSGSMGTVVRGTGVMMRRTGVAAHRCCATYLAS
jgi:hypothetical protein